MLTYFSDTYMYASSGLMLLISNRFVVNPLSLNSSSPGQNGRHFAAYVFKCIFVNEKFCFFSKISLKFIPKGPIENNPALV